jgi:hypothetical protein
VRVSLWRLARELGAYPDLLAALCRFHAIPVHLRGRARTVDADQVDLVRDLLWAYKGRVKLSAYTGRRRRRRPRKRTSQ